MAYTFSSYYNECPNCGFFCGKSTAICGCGYDWGKRNPWTAERKRKAQVRRGLRMVRKGLREMMGDDK